jgi:hypothetical protein
MITMFGSATMGRRPRRSWFPSAGIDWALFFDDYWRRTSKTVNENPIPTIKIIGLINRCMTILPMDSLRCSKNQLFMKCNDYAIS